MSTPILATKLYIPPAESILTTLLNDIITIPDDFILVLDDYHVIDAQPVDKAITFLLEHLPPQMHLVIATREDPNLPLARLRARSQLTELRAADLRFTHLIKPNLEESYENNHIPKIRITGRSSAHGGRKTCA